MAKINYSDEQLQFIECAKKGENVLVDACIGSGKTTAIQGLCNELDGKSILYLTYNKLLKLDAKAKIRNLNVTVQNYHGFAYIELKRKGIKSSIGELIRTYNRIKPKVVTPLAACLLCKPIVGPSLKLENLLAIEPMLNMAIVEDDF